MIGVDGIVEGVADKAVLGCVAESSVPPGRAVDAVRADVGWEVMQDSPDIKECGGDRMVRYGLPVDRDDVGGSIKVVVILPA